MSGYFPCKIIAPKLCKEINENLIVRCTVNFVYHHYYGLFAVAHILLSPENILSMEALSPFFNSSSYENPPPQ